MKNTQSMYAVGIYQGAYPVEKVSEDFFKCQFAIDTEAQFSSIIVFDAHRTAIKDNIEQLKAFKKGDRVKVQFNLRSNSIDRDGKKRWFTNVIVWKVSPYPLQDASDFGDTPGDYPPIASPEDPQYTGAVTTAAPPPAGAADDLPF